MSCVFLGTGMKPLLNIRLSERKKGRYLTVSDTLNQHSNASKICKSSTATSAKCVMYPIEDLFELDFLFAKDLQKLRCKLIQFSLLKTNYVGNYIGPSCYNSKSSLDQAPPSSALLTPMQVNKNIT